MMIFAARIKILALLSQGRHRSRNQNEAIAYFNLVTNSSSCDSQQSCRHAKEIPKGPSFTRVFPHAQRISMDRQVSWLPGRCLPPPSRFPSGIWRHHFPVTVAGTAPESHRLPFSPCFHKAPVTAGADRGSSDSVNRSRPRPSAFRLPPPRYAIHWRLKRSVSAPLHRLAMGRWQRKALTLGRRS